MWRIQASAAVHAYLSAAAKIGADVGFVLTGARAEAGSPEEALFVIAYRNVTPEVKRAVLIALGANVAASSVVALHRDQGAASKTT